MMQLLLWTLPTWYLAVECPYITLGAEIYAEVYRRLDFFDNLVITSNFWG